MKKEMRILGIDDAPFDKSRDKKTLVIATLFRGGSFIDGVLSTKIRVDGSNSTARIADMVNKCKFKPQLQAILLDGIAVGGFNVIDIQELNKRTKIPVIVVMRDYPNLKKIKSALVKLKKEEKLVLLEKAGHIHKAGEIHIQVCGISVEDAKQIIKITATHSFIPEPIRVAHLIAGGIASGESKGRA